MTLSHIIAAIEDYAPLSLQEKWDNSGLQIGLPAGSDGECTGVMLCVDVTPDVIAEAQRHGCNLVLSHHPLIFRGLKCIAGRTLQERAAADAIRAGIAVYSSHTALDSTEGGVSYAMAEKIGARVIRPLAPAPVAKAMMTVICPRRMADDVRLMLLDRIDRVGSCDLSGDSLAPDPGLPGSFSIAHEPLCRVEALVKASDAGRIEALLSTLPGAERLRTSVTATDSGACATGLGVVAVFDEPPTMAGLVHRLHDTFGTPAIKASRGYAPAEPVRTIALCGGAGGEFIGNAVNAGAQAYITGDVRYHDFADAIGSSMAIFDIGHFESERCAEDIFHKVINNKFPDLKVLRPQSEVCPVLYL